MNKKKKRESSATNFRSTDNETNSRNDLFFHKTYVLNGDQKQIIQRGDLCEYNIEQGRFLHLLT